MKKVNELVPLFSNNQQHQQSDLTNKQYQQQQIKTPKSIRRSRTAAQRPGGIIERG
jgi:hypothetical protein